MLTSLFRTAAPAHHTFDCQQPPRSLGKELSELDRVSKSIHEIKAGIGRTADQTNLQGRLAAV